MNCNSVQKCLSAYLDQELSGAQMLAVRAHLSRCSTCANEFEALSVTKSAMARLAIHEPSEHLVSRVVAVATAQERASAPSFRQVGVLVAVAAAAAVMAVFLFNAASDRNDRSKMANERSQFDAGADAALTTPDFGGHAPIVPVSR